MIFCSRLLSQHLISARYFQRRLPIDAAFGRRRRCRRRRKRGGCERVVLSYPRKLPRRKYTYFRLHGREQSLPAERKGKRSQASGSPCFKVTVLHCNPSRSLRKDEDCLSNANVRRCDKKNGGRVTKRKKKERNRVGLVGHGRTGGGIRPESVERADTAERVHLSRSRLLEVGSLRKTSNFRRRRKP